MNKDYQIIRELAKKCAEIAADPKNEELKRQWYKLNSLKTVRPMYIIEELPWHEFNSEGELTLYCENDVCRMLERDLRRRLWKHRHLHDDFVFEPYIDVPIVAHGVTKGSSSSTYYDYGISIEENTISQGEEGSISAHSYHDMLSDDEALEKFRCPEIYLNEEETSRRETIAREAIGDILDVRMNGFSPYYAAWDLLVQFRGVQPVMFSMIEDPDFIHRTIRKILDVSLKALDQLEDKGLLAHPQNLIHYSGAWTDELPDAPAEDGKYHPSGLWTYGMAQILYTVSPEMHNEFEFEYAPEWYSRFGLVNYGCCEPLEDRMDYVRKIPNIRKLSTSAFVRDYDRMSEAVSGDYILSYKPAPSLVSGASWDPEAIEKNLRMLLKSAQRYGNTCEFTLKDVSTVSGKPEYLTEWSKIMRRVIEEG